MFNMIITCTESSQGGHIEMGGGGGDMHSGGRVITGRAH